MGKFNAQTVSDKTKYEAICLMSSTLIYLAATSKISFSQFGWLLVELDIMVLDCGIGIYHFILFIL